MGIITKPTVTGNKSNNVLKLTTDGKKPHTKCICKSYTGILKYTMIHVATNCESKYLRTFE